MKFLWRCAKTLYFVKVQYQYQYQFRIPLYIHTCFLSQVYKSREKGGLGASVVGRLKLAMRGVALTESVANCEDKKQLLLLNDKLGMYRVIQTLPPYTQQDPRVTYKNWVHIPKINYKRRKLVEFKSKGRTRTISMYCYIKHLTLRKHQSIVASSCRCATVISGSKLPEPWFIPVFGGFHYH